MKMIFIFIDGLGIGENNPRINPFCKAHLSAFKALINEYGVYRTDAALGVGGLPQSATGQTAIYTGINAPKVLGRHWSARPTEKLRDIIMQGNLFTCMKQLNKSVTFANVYTIDYLEQMKNNPRGIFKPSVTTLLCLSADIPFRVLKDYNNGYGVYHDITGRRLNELYGVPMITPSAAAENLHRVSRGCDLTLFEFFMSDIAGHSRDMDKAVYELELIDGMLGHLISLMDLNEDVILITSDHGNIEDISVPTHTYNPVPTILAGRGIDSGICINSLMDITPAVLRIFEESEG